MVELQGRGPSTRRVWRPSALGSSAARPGPREPPPQGSHSMQGREGTISCPPGNSAPSWSTGAGSALSSGQPGRGGHRVKEGSKDPNLPPPATSPRLDSRGRRTRRARAPEFHLTTLRLSCPFLASAGGGTGSLQGRSKRLSLGSFRDNLGKVCVCGGEGVAGIAVIFRVLLSPERREVDFPACLSYPLTPSPAH